jgi:amino acid adenylation domain-containing protein
MDRSTQVITAILGTLLAGCAHVPLDPSYPVERLKDMTADTQSPLILTLSAYAPLFEGLGLTVRLLDQAVPISSKTAADLGPLSGPDSAAYVIYTSGSTGKPKGVVCHHRGVLNLLGHFQRIQPLSRGDRCSWWTSLNFDVSVYEIFAPLMEGGTMVIVPEAMRPDGPRFMAWLAENRITSAYVPPFMVPDLLEWVRKHPGQSMLRRLLVGLEPIPERTLVEIENAVPGLQIINGYGLTETTVCATLYPISSNQPIHDNTPIGRPVQNTALYVLNEERFPVPQGSDGELYIGGAGVALGYWNRPGLTAERFVPGRFSGEPAARLYKTGELVRLLPDGNLEFLGRTDFQIKFRGFRIEPGEIETALRSHGGVRDAVVMLREDSMNRPQLTAHVAPHDGNSLQIQDLRDHLKTLVPEYMIPSVLPVGVHEAIFWWFLIFLGDGPSRAGRQGAGEAPCVAGLNGLDCSSRAYSSGGTFGVPGHD